MISKSRILIILAFFMSGILYFNLVDMKDTNLNQDVNKIKKGVLDLRDCTFEDGKIITLNGEWEIYPGNKMTQNELSQLKQKKYKEDLEKDELQGYGTIYTKIILPKNNMKLALKTPRIDEEYDVVINGDKVENFESRYKDPFKLVDFISYSKKVDLIIYGKYNLNRKFNILNTIKLSREDILREKDTEEIKINYFIIGAILITGIYHLVIFLFRRESVSNLYFALFSLLMLLRMATMLDLGATIGFESGIMIRIEFFTFYIGIAVFTLYIWALYRDEFPKKINQGIITFSLIFSTAVLILPERYYTKTLKFYQVFSVLVGLYIVFMIGKLFLEKVEGSLLFMVAFMIMFIGMIHDILVIDFYIDNTPIFYRTLLLFLILQSIYLSRKFAMALNREENLLSKLRVMNLNLENEVKERTLELEEKNIELLRKTKMDGLTNLYNHKTIYEKLENRIIKAKQGILSEFSILMCDVDDFKGINDNYGHQVGDKVLKIISLELKNSIRGLDMAGRYGGEEFLVIFSGIDLKIAEKISNRIRKKISSADLKENGLRITISGGVTEYRPGDTTKTIIKRADEGLYEAKNTGKDKIEKR
ncbi:MAG: sensor domain-containing diguanylate cyclase [Fusobacteriota bacterium]